MRGADWERRRRSGVRILYTWPDSLRARGQVVGGEDRVIALLYADDLALLAEDEDALRRLVMSFERVTQAAGLTVNGSSFEQAVGAVGEVKTAKK